MLKYVTPVLLFSVAVSCVDTFVFPDEVSSKSWGGAGYDDDNYGNHEFGNARHQGYNGNYHDNNGGFAPAYGNQHGYYEDKRPSYPGTGSYSQANAQSTGIGSAANAESGSQNYNDFSQSNARAESHGYQPPISSYPYGPSDNRGSASASSSAVSSGLINGASSATATATASGGASSASASSSSSSGGFPNRPNQLPPWYFRSRIADEDSDNSTDIEPSSTAVDDDKIIFTEE